MPQHRLSAASLKNLPNLRQKSQAEIQALVERLSHRVISDFGPAKVKSSEIIVRTTTGAQHAVSELSMFGTTGWLWGRKAGGELVVFAQPTIESISLPDAQVFQR